MSHHVPEFDLDEFCPAPTSGQSRQKNMQDDDDNNDHKIMELVWHSGQPAVQNKSSSQRLSRIPSPPQHHMLPSPPTEQQPPPPLQPQSHLFMQEDEMTSWLHYPLEDDTSFDQHISDLLYHPPGPGPGPSAAPPPPSSSACALPPQPPPPPKLPPPQRHHQFFRHQTRPQPRPPAHPSAPVGVNFPQFARLKPRLPESGASSNNNKLRESTVVDSSDTLKSSFLPVSSSPAVKLSRRESINDSAAIAATSAVGGGGGSSMSMNMDTDTYGCSRSDGSATATMDLMGRRPSHDRKRKGFESTDTYTGTESEDVAVESYDMKKQCRGTAFGKRSRAAEVHNLSERKRRDKINEKMKALQELIPRCTKTDKASMLDEAIEYMKSLQMQLQMMSAGYYGMVPMMFPGVQQYMPMGMGMEMRMNRPMVPFPIQTPGASSSIEPRFQFPAFHTPPIPTFHPVNVQTNQMQTNQMEPVGNLNCPSDANVYQQYLGAQQMPLQHIFENPPPISTPSTSKASTSTSKEAEDHENHPSGTDMHYSHNK